MESHHIQGDFQGAKLERRVHCVKALLAVTAAAVQSAAVRLQSRLKKSLLLLLFLLLVLVIQATCFASWLLPRSCCPGCCCCTRTARGDDTSHGRPQTDPAACPDAPFIAAHRAAVEAAAVQLRDGYAVASSARLLYIHPHPPKFTSEGLKAAAFNCQKQPRRLTSAIVAMLDGAFCTRAGLCSRPRCSQLG